MVQIVEVDAYDEAGLRAFHDTELAEWGGSDLNRRPSDYESLALTN